MNISVLHSNNYSPNEVCFLVPLYKVINELKGSYGINLKFTNSLKNIECDIVILSSKWFTEYWLGKGVDYIYEILTGLRSRVKKIIWYDISDSTGTTHFMVLPYVDLYLKNQILKDKNKYLTTYHGARIYSEFIHTRFNVDEGVRSDHHLNYIPDSSDLVKVMNAWNSGLGYFGRYREIHNYLFKYPCLRHLRYKNKWKSPYNLRSHLITCRIGTKYSCKTISMSRQLIKSKLSHILPSDKISHKAYLKELRNTVSAISPFGLGEISLRDFEIAISGACIIKQDMSHICTWPNLWIKDESYLPFEWDMSDLQYRVQFAVDNPKIMQEYATLAQEKYKHIVDSSKSSEIFCNRLCFLLGIRQSNEVNPIDLNTNF